MQHRTGHRTLRIAVAAIVTLGVPACSSGQSGTAANAGTPAPAATTPASAVQLVDAVKAAALAADPSVVVVDVRTPAEFAEGHLARAELVDANAADFRDQIAKLDRSATYLVYCHSGNRSGRATGIMAELGFVRVYNLDGGILAWQGAGAPVVK